MILTEQPGLLGPKALFVVMGMSLARDEILWLQRHASYGRSSARAQHGSKATRGGAPVLPFDDDLIDRYLPELLFRLEELRGLMRKYNEVIQCYHRSFLSGYDVQFMDSLIQVKSYIILPT